MRWQRQSALTSQATARMTQQQVNRKRQRATPFQASVLERNFSENPTPDSDKQKEIGGEISMTIRSVQIWFQNRYDLMLSRFFEISKPNNVGVLNREIF